MSSFDDSDYSNDLPRLADTKASLLREAELTLPLGAALIPAELIAEVERKARVWVCAHMVLAGSSAVDMQDELGVTLPTLHMLKRDPEVLATVAALRQDMDRAIQDRLAAASYRGISALERIRDDPNTGAEHRVKAGLGLLSSYQDRAAKEASTAKGGGGTNIAIILNQANAKAGELPTVELEDIRRGGGK